MKNFLITICSIVNFAYAQESQIECTINRFDLNSELATPTTATLGVSKKIEAYGDKIKDRSWFLTGSKILATDETLITAMPIGIDPNYPNYTSSANSDTVAAVVFSKTLRSASAPIKDISKQLLYFKCKRQ